jgi:hypothetical protein
VIGNLVVLALAIALALLIARPLRQNLPLAGIVFLALLFTLQFARVGIMGVREKAAHQEAMTDPKGLQELLGVGTYNTVKKYDPPLFTTLATSFSTLGRDSSLLRKFRVAAEQQIMRDAVSRLPRASDEAATIYLRLRVASLTEARNVGAETCYRQLAADEMLEEWSKLPQPLADDVRAFVGHAMRSAGENPQDAPTQFDYDVISSPVLKAFRAEQGQDAELLDDTRRADPKTDKLRACNVHIAFLNRLQKLSPNEASVMIRHLVNETRKARTTTVTAS